MRLAIMLLLVGTATLANAQQKVDADSQTERAALPPRSQLQETALEQNVPSAQHRRLGEGTDSFLGLFLPAASPAPQGAVLLIGDQGEHANWPELISPARQQLSEAGWHTLSIALPDALSLRLDLEKATSEGLADARASQIIGRIALALDSLRTENGAGQITLLGRGSGAYWVLHAAAERDDVKALILYQPRMPTQASESLEALVMNWEKPLLEVLLKGRETSSGDYQARALNAKRLGHQQYRQLTVHDPAGRPQNQRMLIKRINGWLDQLAGPQRNPR